MVASSEFEDLRRRAAAGDLQAQTEVGKALLRAPGPRRPEAIRVLDGAAAGGSGEAAALVAVLAAAGDGTPQNWSAALRYLARAAEMGWAPAQAQLRVLAGQTAEGPRPAGGWRTLAAGVDVAQWLRPPPPLPLSRDPLIEAYPGFVAGEVCRWLIARAEGRTEPAQIQASDSRPVLSAHRTNSVFGFSIVDMDVIGVLLQAKMAAIGGFDLVNLERLNLLRYEPGQQFGLHHDWLNVDSPGVRPELEALGQRIGTVLVYLNDEFEGGETSFPEAGVTRRGEVGEALFFRNVTADGRPDPKTLHAGLPPRSGVKWVVSQWVRQRPGAPLPRRAELRSASA